MHVSSVTIEMSGRPWASPGGVGHLYARGLTPARSATPSPQEHAPPSAPQSAAPILKTGQPGARTATAPGSGSGQIQILPAVALDPSALPNRGGGSRSKPEASRD